MADVVLGAEQPELLAAPEREADAVGLVDAERRHVLDDLEERRRARAVVVDAGSLGDRVEVRADDDGALGPPLVESAITFCDGVVRARPFRRAAGVDAVPPSCHPKPRWATLARACPRNQRAPGPVTHQGRGDTREETTRACAACDRDRAGVLMVASVAPTASARL
jgi:hypothetical protein